MDIRLGPTGSTEPAVIHAYRAGAQRARRTGVLLKPLSRPFAEVVPSVRSSTCSRAPAGTVRPGCAWRSASPASSLSRHLRAPVRAHRSRAGRHRRTSCLGPRRCSCVCFPDDIQAGQLPQPLLRRLRNRRAQFRSSAHRGRRLAMHEHFRNRATRALLEQELSHFVALAQLLLADDVAALAHAPAAAISPRCRSPRSSAEVRRPVPRTQPAGA